MAELELKVRRRDACMVLKCRLDNVNDLYKRFDENRQAIEDECPAAELPMHQETANKFF